MRKIVSASVVALVIGGCALLTAAPASASLDDDTCTVWVVNIFSTGNCHTYTIPANTDGHWVRGGLEYGRGGTYRIRDADTGSTVCGEHTAWSDHERTTCFGLYGRRYRVDVIGAPFAAIGWVENY